MKPLYSAAKFCCKSHTGQGFTMFVNNWYALTTLGLSAPWRVEYPIGNLSSPFAPKLPFQNTKPPAPLHFNKQTTHRPYFGKFLKTSQFKRIQRPFQGISPIESRYLGIYPTQLGRRHCSTRPSVLIVVDIAFPSICGLSSNKDTRLLEINFITTPG
jgi:hypothetical protein